MRFTCTNLSHTPISPLGFHSHEWRTGGETSLIDYNAKTSTSKKGFGNLRMVIGPFAATSLSYSNFTIFYFLGHWSVQLPGWICRHVAGNIPHRCIRLPRKPIPHLLLLDKEKVWNYYFLLSIGVHYTGSVWSEFFKLLIMI